MAKPAVILIGLALMVFGAWDWISDPSVAIGDNMVHLGIAVLGFIMVLWGIFLGRVPKYMVPR